MEKTSVTPLLLGLDLGAYSMAVAFHEYIGAISHAMGREPLGATSNSKIVVPHIVPDLLNKSAALSAISDFARDRESVLLVPCEDWYVRLVSDIRDGLAENVRVVLPSGELISTLSDKIKFYKLLDGFGIDYPRAAVFYSAAEISPKILDGFSYPAVIKPADSTEYWAHPFVNMKKVYFPEGAPEAEQIIGTVFASGYERGVILQEKIGKSHEKIGVYTAVYDKEGYIGGVFGEVMLGEPTPTGRGNHVAIITAKKPEICKKLDLMLEKLGYIGIANFDLISDGERWFVLELNPRAGRSSDYTRAAGVNLAGALLKIAFGEEVPPLDVREILWRCIPRGTLYRFCQDGELLRLAKRLVGESRESCVYSYHGDIHKNPRRALYSFLHGIRHSRRFKKELEK